MATLPIILQHGGRWDEYGKYVDFTVDAIVISTDSNFETLVDTVAQQLKVDRNDKDFIFKYKASDQCPALEIYNDMGVRVYILLKTGNRDIGLYPLCITLKNAVKESDYCSEDAKISSDACGESWSTPAICNGDTVSEIGLGSCEEHEIAAAGIINNYMPTEVFEGQVYRDKEMVVSVMKKYALRHNVQFKVDRSSLSR